jgi:hypothetical protein
MMTTLRSVSAIVLASVSAVAMLGGCASPPRTTTVTGTTVPVVTTYPATSYPAGTYPAASATTIIVPPAAPQRVTYPEGAYELYGSGTASSPYYWVWVPRGTQASLLPPPPPLPVR